MMRKPRLIILVGNQGSGKTTYCKRLLSNGFSRVSQDDHGKEWGNKLKEHLMARHDVVVDRMNHTKHQRQFIIKLNKVYGQHDVYCVDFTCDFNIALGRLVERKEHPTIKTRDRKELSKILSQFYSQYEQPDLSEGIKQIIKGVL